MLPLLLLLARRKRLGRVRQVVPAKVTVAPELLAAVVVFAHVGLLVGVRAHVGLQVAALVEHLLANVALVRRTLLVDHLVHGQRARLAKALLADAALEGLLVRVDEPGGVLEVGDAESGSSG